MENMNYQVNKIMANRDIICSECKNTNSMKYCFKEGNLVCTSCGFETQRNFVDETAEWRTFGDNSGQGVDPRRAGGVLNENLIDGGLGTLAGGKFSMYEKRLQASSDKSFNLGSSKLKDWAHMLNLQNSIVSRSIELFQKVKSSRKLRGRSMDQILATILFMASRIEKKPLMIPEIESVSNQSRDDIRRCFSIVKRLVPEVISNRPSVFVETISGKLDLKFEINNLAKQIAEKIQELGIVDGKNPKTIAAVSIFVALKISDIQRISMKTISKYSEIAENTIKNAYRDIHSKLADIVPKEISKEALDLLPLVATNS